MACLLMKRLEFGQLQKSVVEDVGTARNEIAKLWTHFQDAWLVQLVQSRPHSTSANNNRYTRLIAR